MLFRFAGTVIAASMGLAAREALSERMANKEAPPDKVGAVVQSIVMIGAVAIVVTNCIKLVKGE